MPELPEVEYGRKLAERVALGRTIERVWCANDAIVFDGVKPRSFARAVKGRRVLASCRWGKQLWLELNMGPHPLFHFGMTGAFRTNDEVPLKLASSPKVCDPSWPPRFVKVRLFFDDGGELAMTNARRFGRIKLRADPRVEPPISELGFDPLLALPTKAEFVSSLQRRKAPIKGVLLDQRFAAGVGNWIADEVLFQARIDPRRPANSLLPEEADRLRRKIGSIIKRAVAVDARKKLFPKTWLFHARWGKSADARTAKGDAIQHITVAGRTTAFVPRLQK